MRSSFLLQKCHLFQGKTEEEIEKILAEVKVQEITSKHGEVIIEQGEVASYLGIVLEGVVIVRKLFPNGKMVTLAQLTQGQTFGESVLFARKDNYPACIEASGSCKILLISKEELLSIFSKNPEIMESYMETVSNRVVFLTRRIELLSLTTLRQKISFYLLNEYEESNSPVINVPRSKDELAAYLGVPRPSLSRELGRMQKEGLLDFDRQKITILDVEALKEELLR